MKTFLALLFSSLLFIGCEKAEEPTPPSESNPEISVGIF